jgi:asparagine synthase (glutamine-hydrolysing)
MCGIAGILFHDFAVSGDVARRSDRLASVDAMLQALIHRGPDDGGLVDADPMYLGHRRLAILDTSNAGQQPMSDPSGRYWLSYNGEIYNHHSLRRELTQLGVRFRSRSDTEVLLHGAIRWGSDLLPKLDGMFAFAFWDGLERRLWLARDGMGIKPLFYHSNDAALTFASEIKGVLAAGISPQCDREALGPLFAFGYVVAPETGFQGIRQLPPGHELYIHVGQRSTPRTQAWFRLPYPSTPTRWSRQESADRLCQALQKSVSLQMESDVPLGAFLSGGLDSSSIVACMHSTDDLTERRFGQPISNRPSIQSFTVAFNESSFDESAPAAAVADRFGTEHHCPVLPGSDFETLQSISFYAEDPIADNSCMAMWLLCQTTARHVTVAVSGDGADELLGGYSTYRASSLAGRYRRIPAWIRRHCIAAAVNRLPDSDRKYSFGMFAKRFVHGAELQPPLDHCSWRTMLSPQLGIPRLSRDYEYVYANALRRYSDSLETAPPWLSPLERWLHLDLAFHLPNDMLVKVDRMSMAHGLEARVPFLGNEVLATCLSIPSQWKIGPDGGKQPLRDAMRERLPASIVRRKKAGLVIPIEAWLRGVWKPQVQSYLNQDFCESTGLLHWPALKAILDAHLSGRQDHGYALYTLLVLALWWKQWFAPTSQIPALRAVPQGRHPIAPNRNLTPNLDQATAGSRHRSPS